MSVLRAVTIRRPTWAGGLFPLGLLLLTFLMGQAIAQANWLIVAVPLAVLGIAASVRWPLAALIVYLYVLALTPQYVGVQVRGFVGLDGARAVGLVVFAGLGLRLLDRYLTNKDEAGHPFVKYLVAFFLATGLLPALVIQTTPSVLLRAMAYDVIDYAVPCFFLIYYIRDVRARHTVLTHLFIAGIVVAILGAYEFATGHNFYITLHPQLPHADVWTTLYTRGGLPRVEVSFGQSISLGRYFAMLLPLALGRFATAADSRARLTYALLVALFGFGVVMTLSAGPFWGALVAVAMLLLYRPTSTLSLGLLGAGAVGLIGSLILPLAQLQQVLRAFLGQQTDVSEAVATNAQVRLVLFSVVTNALPRSPWFGFGSVDAVPFLAAIIPSQDIVSTYVYYLLLYGVLGLALFGLVLAWQIWCAGRIVLGLTRSADRPLALALLAALAGQILIMLDVSPVGVGVQFMWVLFGLIGSLYWTAQRPQRAAGHERVEQPGPA